MHSQPKLINSGLCHQRFCSLRIEHDLKLLLIITSSSRRRCSFCSSMRFCRSCNSCLLCSSGSLRWAASWACCLLWASERSLFSCWRRWKSRLRVDSPGTLRMELMANIQHMTVFGNNYVHRQQKLHYQSMIIYLDSLSSPRFSSSSSLPLYSYSVSSESCIRTKSQTSKKTKWSLWYDHLQNTLVPHCPTWPHLLTFLSPFLACAIDMVFQLNSDLALSGLVPDKGVLEQLFCGWSTGICLHKTAFDEVNEFLGPVRKVKVRGWHSRWDCTAQIH